MANEFKIPAVSGLSLYGNLRDVAGNLYNNATPGFEALNVAHWANYTQSVTDDGTGLFLASMPGGIAQGEYEMVVRLQAGASAVSTDLVYDVYLIDWTGAAIATIGAVSAQTAAAQQQANAQAALTAQGFTTARAGFLDTLNGLVAAIWGAATRTLTAISDPAGVTTLLSRLGQALLFDGSGNVKSAAQNLPSDYARNNVAPSWWVSPDNADVATALADLVSLLGRTDPTTAIAALQATANAIKAKTDLIPADLATGGDVQLTVLKDNL